jgi:hypothetical protein
MRGTRGVAVCGSQIDCDPELMGSKPGGERRAAFYSTSAHLAFMPILVAWMPSPERTAVIQRPVHRFPYEVKT